MRGKKRFISLSEEERVVLRREQEQDTSKVYRRRCLMILLSDMGKSIEELREHFGRSRPGITKWLDRYEAAGVEGLRTSKGQGRPPIVRHDNKSTVDRIEQLVAAHPQKLDQALVEIEAFTGKSMSKKTLKRILKKTAGVGSASAAAWPSGPRPRSSKRPDKD